jgi:hypothetical protein
MIAWSYGGGVQSVAIGVLIREGALPKPDLAVIADTNYERRTTWEYLHGVMQPFLDPIGLKIEIAPHSLARVDLFAKDGRPLVPAYDARQGRLGTFCSGEWKRDVTERWLRLQGVKDCDCWIGYSIDEISRVQKKDHRYWCRYQYPLIDRFVNRAMCFGIIEKAGLPRPHKSRCWKCPHQNDAEWLEVKADPEEWSKAVAFDNLLREVDEGDGLFLYSGRVPLEMATFDAGLNAPSRPCESGHCWT